MCATAIVREIKDVLKIADTSCFVINSRKKDTHGVEGVNELLKGIYDTIDPDLREVFLAHLSKKRREEFLQYVVFLSSFFSAVSL